MELERVSPQEDHCKSEHERLLEQITAFASCKKKDRLEMIDPALAQTLLDMLHITHRLPIWDYPHPLQQELFDSLVRVDCRSYPARSLVRKEHTHISVFVPIAGTVRRLGRMDRHSIIDSTALMKTVDGHQQNNPKPNE